MIRRVPFVVILAMAPKHAKTTSDEDSGSPKKHAKKLKDPNAPKKPRSAYILWITENRAKIAEEGMKPAEVMKKAGEMWNTVDAKTKKVRAKRAFVRCQNGNNCVLCRNTRRSLKKITNDTTARWRTMIRRRSSERKTMISQRSRAQRMFSGAVIIGRGSPRKA